MAAIRHCYRADIDGLRAVAVLSVILFHAGVAAIRGGFVGVDIFFVISGYLITGIIDGEMAQGRFSLARFYERRIRRILPALLAVLCFTTVATAVLFLPPDFRNYSVSAVTALLFSSNFFFWRISNYFGPLAQTSPLLHTWSLAIEEQFYLAFPLLLLGLRRLRRRHLVTILAAAMVAMFLADDWATAYKPTAAFFLPVRGWPLLLGALLNFLPAIPGRMTRECAAAAGLLASVAGVFFLSRETAYPGIAIALPCFGAALVIWSGQGAMPLANQLLALRPLAFTGLISYSLYLWHWPFLVFFAYGREVTPVHTAVVLGAAILAALLSWRYIEQPFRGHGSGISRNSLYCGCAALALLLGMAGVAGYLSHGWPQRFDPAVARLAQYTDYAETAESRQSRRDGTCFSSIRDPLSVGRIEIDWKACMTPATRGPNLLLWGDSHAAHYALGLDQLASSRGAHLMQTTVAGCPPLLGFSNPAAAGCNRINDLIFSRLAQSHVDGVILSAHWASLLGPDGVQKYLPGTIKALSDRGIPVLLIGPSIEFTGRLPIILARERQVGSPVVRAEPYLFQPALAVDRAMRKTFGTIPGVIYASPFDSACNDGCPVTTQDGMPLVFDNSHLTAAGSREIARRTLSNPLDRLLAAIH